eukprot:scaffold8728_cov164-Amphora_coffeaeformis.AAC.2
MFQTRHLAARIRILRKKNAVNDPPSASGLAYLFLRCAPRCNSFAAVMPRTLVTTVSTKMVSSTSKSPQVSKQPDLDFKNIPIQKQANIICVANPNDKANLDLYKLAEARKDGVQVVRIGDTVESFAGLEHENEKINNLPRFVRQRKLLNPVHLTITPGQAQHGRAGSSRKHCRIQTTDFAAFVRESQAFRFKVHRPGCKCGKVKRIVWPARGPPMDSFWVLKDTPSMDVVFCGGSAASYQTDPLTCEMTLHEVVFADDQAPPFKISCALCMLQNHPNGFVCVTADTAAVVDRARDMARQERTAKLERGQTLHSDHAHSICTVSVAALKNHVKNKKVLMEELQRQGVEGLSPHTKIKLGHHLKVSLESLEHEYILVMVFDDKTFFSLDLPGGKRQLGEGSWECAVRETEEETSLKIDQNWLVGTPRINECNLFYMAHPPEEKDPNELAESLRALTLGATTKDS